ncbi:hypothetical protein CEXT_187911 [Caerostris extrusa]|uniref:Uncharacterized protein n=1 Tax=Caerostris extrusa TaxID=172846 RepID=A0AAV4MNH8_CAEEX|nr:hypothetical protein CEXT_187911 [Caerostris extrusa]
MPNSLTQILHHYNSSHSGDGEERSTALQNSDCINLHHSLGPERVYICLCLLCAPHQIDGLGRVSEGVLVVQERVAVQLDVGVVSEQQKSRQKVLVLD